jgi:hypothetical protein
MANVIPRIPKSIQMMNRMLIACGTLSDTLVGKKSAASSTPTLLGLIRIEAMFCVMTAPVVNPQKYIPVPRPFLFSNHSQTMTSVADMINPDPRQDTKAYQNLNQPKDEHKLNAI